MKKFKFKVEFRNFRTNYSYSEDFHVYAVDPSRDDTSVEQASAKFLGIYYDRGNLVDDSSIRLLCDGKEVCRVIKTLRNGISWTSAFAV